jgi:hypothetical protein
MPPFTLSIDELLALLIIASDNDPCGIELDSAVVDKLAKLGLIEHGAESELISNKGTVYLDHLCSQPLPMSVVRWVMPK